jgi:hypothetical protein
MKNPVPIDEQTLDTVEINQTLFSSQEPLFEKNSLPVDPSAVVAPAERKKPPILFLILGAVGVVLLMAITGLALLPKPMRQQLLAQPSPTPVNQAELTDQQKRIQELESDLHSADPTQLDLPFPQVRMNLSIQEEKNR